MRLFIRHETQYDYDMPIAYSAQRLYLWPVDFATQKTVNWAIEAPGIEKALNYFDGFGNRVHMLTFQAIRGPVSIVAEGIPLACTRCNLPAIAQVDHAQCGDPRAHRQASFRKRYSARTAWIDERYSYQGCI